jgi:hypothetical protein
MNKKPNDFPSIDPVESYEGPNIPTLADASKDASILGALPLRWKHNAKVIACAGLIGALVLSGCGASGEPQSADEGVRNGYASQNASESHSGNYGRNGDNGQFGSDAQDGGDEQVSDSDHASGNPPPTPMFTPTPATTPYVTSTPTQEPEQEPELISDFESLLGYPSRIGKPMQQRREEVIEKTRQIFLDLGLQPTNDAQGQLEAVEALTNWIIENSISDRSLYFLQERHTTDDNHIFSVLHTLLIDGRSTSTGDTLTLASLARTLGIDTVQAVVIVYFERGSTNRLVFYPILTYLPDGRTYVSDPWLLRAQLLDGTIDSTEGLVMIPIDDFFAGDWSDYEIYSTSRGLVPEIGFNN